MGICTWLFLGGISGWLSSIFAGTNARQGIIGNIIVGVIGAMLGGALFSYFGGHDVTGFNLYSIMVATVGGVILLAIKNLLFGRK
ncbi:MAG: GlsB/YeaQ/YmgE family stress response membrane protein [Archangium sp.]